MRETRDLEFKESVSNLFLKTVSAYANYSGGRILFGVNDEGVATGLPNPKQACLDTENKINDSITSQPSYALEINESDSTVELRVNPGLAKPYLYRAKAAGELEEGVPFGRSKLRRILKGLIAKGVVEEVGRGRGLKYRRK